MELEITKNVLAALEREGVRYLVFGAVALNLLGLARATEDIDIFIAPERENVQRLKAALRSVFADPAIEEISADDLLGDYPAVQYVPPEGDYHLDILTRLGEAFRFRDLEAVRVDLDGQPVWVASPRTLYQMKKDTVRAKDRGDAELLRRRFNLECD
jgi:Nucleotidyl transferase AbiEii toxin, Type IV TA system